MRRHTRGWATGMVAALLASNATAQLVPAPVTVSPPKVSTPSVKAPTLAPSVTTRTVRGTLPKSPVTVTSVPSIRGSLGAKSLPNGTTISSPLLSAPLGSVKSVTTRISAPLGNASTVGVNLPASRPPSGLALARPTSALALDRLISTFVPANSTGSATLLADRSARLSAYASASGGRLEQDAGGNLVVRGHVVLIDPDPRSLQQMLRRGFRILSDDRDAWLGLRAVTLNSPGHMQASAALRLVHGIDPRVTADYDHVYEPAGGALGPAKSLLARARGGGTLTIGMVDGGVAAHPALSGHILEQRGFAGAARPTGHGTAVASLIAGSQGRFHGAATNASLIVADVYGGQVAAGSASRIVQALGWLASQRPSVINMSLVGPDNALLRRAIAAVRGRGIPVVAAVGNDGPAAPPQYPASYPGVISVTGVDARGIALFESGNATHLDFAAPGADMAAARPGGSYARVRGTSFASPLAAGRLAMAGSVQRLASEARPGKGRVGRGIVCAACRTDPGAVGAR